MEVSSRLYTFLGSISNFPLSINSINSLKSSAVSFGDVLVQRPHQTPTMDTPFTRVIFSGIFGISP